MNEKEIEKSKNDDNTKGLRGKRAKKSIKEKKIGFRKYM
jgi:hypothetical protein